MRVASISMALIPVPHTIALLFQARLAGYRVRQAVCVESVTPRKAGGLMNVTASKKDALLRASA